MNRKYIPIFVCPECKTGELTIKEVNNKKNDEIIDSLLICKNCSEFYFIDDRILRLLPRHLCDTKSEKKLMNKYNLFIEKKFYYHKEEFLNEDNGEQNDEENWIISEKVFWDQNKYKKQLESNYIPPYIFNRFEVRKTHLVKPLQIELNDKMILEIGGGNCGTIYHILNPEQNQFHFFGTDISYNSLKVAQKLHPTSNFIQCDAVDLPIKKEQFDIIFELGLLHHLPNNLAALENHIELLKSGGYLGLHDPTNRRKALLSRYKILKKFKTEQSDHNEYVDEKGVTELLKTKGKIIHTWLEYSPIRNWSVKCLIDWLGMNNKYIYKLLVFSDQFVIRTLGKVFKIFDGNALLILFQKK